MHYVLRESRSYELGLPGEIHKFLEARAGWMQLIGPVIGLECAATIDQKDSARKCCSDVAE